MRKYYYYVGVHSEGASCEVISSEGIGFPLLEAQKALERRERRRYIITFWKEISSEEYQRYFEYLHK